MFDINKNSNDVFNKLTPEVIVFKYLVNMQSGDFSILDEISDGLHQQIAYELIKAGESKLLVDNLDKFSNIDIQSLISALQDAGENFLIDKCSGYFQDINPEEVGRIIDNI